jgi:hypothetical protein
MLAILSSTALGCAGQMATSTDSSHAVTPTPSFFGSPGPVTVPDSYTVAGSTITISSVVLWDRGYPWSAQDEGDYGFNAAISALVIEGTVTAANDKDPFAFASWARDATILPNAADTRALLGHCSSTGEGASPASSLTNRTGAQGQQPSCSLPVGAGPFTLPYGGVAPTSKSYRWGGGDGQQIDLSPYFSVSTATPRPEIDLAQVKMACTAGTPLPNAAKWRGGRINQYAVGVSASGSWGLVETDGAVDKVSGENWHAFVNNVTLSPTTVQIIVCQTETSSLTSGCGPYQPGNAYVDQWIGSEKVRVIVASTGKTIGTKTFNGTRSCPGSIRQGTRRIDHYPDFNKIAAWIKSL